jgi:hypothetical protein
MRSGRAIQLGYHFIVVHAHLVQLEEFCDRFLIALFGGVQKTPALIHLFFFGMRSGPSFHAIPFASPAAILPSLGDDRRKIAELYQNFHRFEMPSPYSRGCLGLRPETAADMYYV